MFEINTIIFHGIKEMYEENKDVFYYLTLGNENYLHPEMPKGVEEGIIKGLYKFKASDKKKKKKVNIFASGSIMNSALEAQEYLTENYDIDVDIWSATNYKQLRTDAINCDRYNMLNPDQKKKESYLEKTLKKETGVFVAVSDNMRIVPDQISKWVPGGLFTLGTDGFGRSDTREQLRRFFEIDKESICVACLYQLALKKEVTMATVKKAIKELGIDPEKSFPEFI